MGNVTSCRHPAPCSCVVIDQEYGEARWCGECFRGRTAGAARRGYCKLCALRCAVLGRRAIQARRKAVLGGGPVRAKRVWARARVLRKGGLRGNREAAGLAQSTAARGVASRATGRHACRLIKKGKIRQARQVGVVICSDKRTADVSAAGIRCFVYAAGRENRKRGKIGAAGLIVDQREQRIKTLRLVHCRA